MDLSSDDDELKDWHNLHVKNETSKAILPAWPLIIKQKNKRKENKKKSCEKAEASERLTKERKKTWKRKLNFVRRRFF